MWVHYALSEPTRVQCQGMDIAFFQHAQQLFDELIELPAAERAAVLASQAAGDMALIDMVQELLEADEEPLVGLEDILLHAAGTPNPVPQIQPGATIGRYVLEKMLGRGGMAEVWAVRHTLLGTHYALKLLTHATPALQRRLLSEGRAQARLQHANIVPVWDILDIDGVPGLLMLLVRGPSLSQLIADAPLSRAAASGMLRGIVEGVAHAHRCGLVHRDLKPDNVLIDLSTGVPVPRVGDFGLVKTTAQAGETLHGVVMGTPAYAAPELLRDAATATAAADRFSLGVMLVELLAGHRPFAGSSVYEMSAVHSQPPDLSGLDAPMQALAAGLLDLDPLKRPTCEDIIAALTAAPPSPASQQALVERARQLSVFKDGEVSLSSPRPTPVDNLPAPRDAFIGRETMLEALVAQVSGGAQLLTLLGPGGVGKTRLALEVGRQLAVHFPGGVWFCDAAEARDQDALLAAVARALSIRVDQGGLPCLTELLADQGRTLLILDNLEQVRDPAAHLISGWLDPLPELCFLCTSRAPLRIRGEQVVPVPVMDTREGAALFIERAARVSPGIQYSDEEQAVIRDLIALLDGLPLAIELAAARSRLASPERLRSRLSRRFKLLSTSSPDRPERQQTLWRTLQWSWDLLTPAARQCLAQLSVFEDGFTVNAAEAVVVFDDEEWIEEVLDALVESCWLIVQTDARGAVRLTMLRSIHDFAAAQLDEAQAIAAGTRHGAYFAGLKLDERRTRHRRRLLAEGRNITAALLRAARRRDEATIRALTELVGAIAQLQGPLTLGASVLTEVLQTPGLTDPTRFTVVFRLIHLHRLLGWREEALAGMEEARQLAERTGSPRHRQTILSLTAYDQMQHGELDEALSSYQEILAADLAGARFIGAIICYNNIGVIHMRTGRPHESMEAIFEALKLSRAHGIDHHAVGSLLNLAQTRLNLGQITAALENIEEGGALTERLGDRLRRSSFSQYRGLAMVHLGRSDLALTHTARAVALCEDLGAARHLWIARTLHAQALAGCGETDAALALLGGSLRYCEAERIFHITASIKSLQAQIHLARGELDAARETAWCAVEQARQLGHVLLEARARIVLVEVLIARGERTAAVGVLWDGLALALYPREEGVLRAHLAACLVEQGSLADVREVLAPVDGLLEGVERCADRGAWLLSLARVALHTGDEVGANQARAELEAFLVELRGLDADWLRARLQALSP